MSGAEPVAAVAEFCELVARAVRRVCSESHPENRSSSVTAAAHVICGLSRAAAVSGEDVANGFSAGDWQWSVEVVMDFRRGIDAEEFVHCCRDVTGSDGIAIGERAVFV